MNQSPSRQWIVIGFGVIVAAIVAVLATAVVTLPVEATGLAGEVTENLDQAGVENPVTAVLLNFRGYDTLLEIGVLLLAVLGARVLATAGLHDDTAHCPPDNPVLFGFVRVVSPVMIVVAGYLLWIGGHAPGGAFQAGAVLAALGVLLQLGGVNWMRYISAFGERLLLVVGLAVFLTVGLGTVWGDGRLLEYSPGKAKWLILLIETAATLSIAMILLALFCCGTIRDARPFHQTQAREGR